MADPTDYENQNGVVAPEEDVDWDKVDVPIPEGGYTVQCIEAEHKVTADGSKNKIVARFEITDCDNQDHQEAVGRNLFAHMVVGASGFMIKRFAKEAGLALPARINGQTCQELAEQMIGTTAHCTVNHNEFPKGSGEMRSNIQTFGNAAAAGGAPAAQTNGTAQTNGHAKTAAKPAKPAAKPAAPPPKPAPKAAKPAARR